MLLVYAIVLGLIIILQCVAGILAFIFSDETEEVVARQMEKFIKTYTGSDDVQTDHVLNLIMEEYDCCGMNNYTDWRTLTNKMDWVQANVPDSCCVTMSDRCGWGYFDEDVTEKEPIHQEGCLTKFLSEFKLDENVKIFGICAIVFLFLELIQIIIACALRNDAKGVLA